MKNHLFKYMILPLALLLWSGAMAVALAEDYDPMLPPEPLAKYKVTVVCDSVGQANLSGNGTYQEGSSVWINASATDACHQFAYWTKDGVEFSTNSGFYYTVGTAPVTFVAHFSYVAPVEPEYDPALPQEPTYQEPVVVIPSYPLYLTCEPASSGSFNRSSGFCEQKGTEVYCQVYPNQDFEFLGWYDAAGELISTSSSFYYTMPNSAATLQARFDYNPSVPADPATEQAGGGDNNAEQRFTLVAASSGHGTVSSSSSNASELVGTTITLTAVADSHYHFTYWSDGSNENPHQVTVSRNETITAYFEGDPFTLTYKVDGTVYKKDTVAYGTALSLIAAPTQVGYTFSGWSEIPATMPAQNVEVTGSFTLDEVTGIEQIGQEAEATGLYNLSGQRIQQPTGRKLFIQNGRKKIIKI